jgi:hypothetical protein
MLKLIYTTEDKRVYVGKAHEKRFRGHNFFLWLLQSFLSLCYGMIIARKFNSDAFRKLVSWLMQRYVIKRYVTQYKRPDDFVAVYTYTKTRGSVVGWDAILQAGRSRVRVPMRSVNLLNLPNPLSSTMALRLTKPLKEMSARRSFWG